MKLEIPASVAELSLVETDRTSSIRIIFVVYLVSGFCALIYQTAWQRLLGLFTGADVRSVTIIVAAYLAGLGVGSMIGGIVADRLSSRSAVRLFGLCNLAIAAFALAARLIFYDLLFLRLHMLAANLAALMLVSGLALLVPTTLMGLSLPLLSRALVGSLDAAAQTIGRLEAINIIGAALGALVGGCLLTGTLGFDGASYVGAFGGSSRRPRHVRYTLPGALVVRLTLALILFPSNSRLWATLHGGTEARAIIAEDSTGVTAIITNDAQAILYLGGNAQGAIPFLDVHVILGALPALVHPHPHELLIIGIGSGGTPYAAGLRAETRHVLTVELIGSQLPALTALAQREAGTAVAAMLADPRYQLVVGDGRRELAHSTERFDVIQADAIQPWHAGSGLLYSREFFEQARTRLAAGGVMAQWTPTERTSTSFRQVFPYGVAIGTFMVIGGNEPVAFEARGL